MPGPSTPIGVSGFFVLRQYDDPRVSFSVIHRDGPVLEWFTSEATARQGVDALERLLPQGILADYNRIVGATTSPWQHWLRVLGHGDPAALGGFDQWRVICRRLRGLS